MDLNLNKNIQGNGILYLSLEDVTDKLVFNEELIKEILNRQKREIKNGKERKTKKET